MNSYGQRDIKVPLPMRRRNPCFNGLMNSYQYVTDDKAALLEEVVILVLMD